MYLRWNWKGNNWRGKERRFRALSEQQNTSSWIYIL